MNAVELIAEELRNYGVEAASHNDGSLANAAACYAVSERLYRGTWDDAPLPEGRRRVWPWSENAWKPRDRISDLVLAGALIAAEIGRLQREKEAEACERLDIDRAANSEHWRKIKVTGRFKSVLRRIVDGHDNPSQIAQDVLDEYDGKEGDS